MALFLQASRVSFTLLLLLFSLPLASASHADEGVLNYLYFGNPDTDANFQYAPGFVKSTAKVGYELRKFSTDVVVGFGQGVWDTATGLVNLGAGVLGWGWEKVSNPVQTFNDAKQGVENFFKDPLGNTVKGVQGVFNFGANVVTNYVDYLKDCPEGHFGRCVGKATFEVTTLVVSGGSSGAAKGGSLLSKAKPLITHGDDAIRMQKGLDPVIDAAAQSAKKSKLPATSVDNALPPPKKNLLNPKALEEFDKIALASKSFDDLFARMKKLRDQGVRGTERWEREYFSSAKKNLEKAINGLESDNLPSTKKWLEPAESDLKGVAGEIEVVEELRFKGVKSSDIDVGKTINGQQIDIVVSENGKVKQLIEVKNRQKIVVDDDFKVQFKHYLSAAEETGKKQGFKPEVVFDIRDADPKTLTEFVKTNANGVDVSIVSSGRVVYSSKQVAVWKTVQDAFVDKVKQIAVLGLTIFGQSEAQKQKQEPHRLAKPEPKPSSPSKQVDSKEASSLQSVKTSSSQGNSLVSAVKQVTSFVSTVVGSVKQVFSSPAPASKSPPSGLATPAPKPVSSAPVVSKAVETVKKTVSSAVSKVVSSITSFFSAPKPAPAPVVRSAPAPAPSRSSSSPSRSSGGSRGRR